MHALASLKTIREELHRDGLLMRARGVPSGLLPQAAVAERRFAVPVRQGEEGGRGLVGLQNLGNTCFLNACIQCLAAVPPFRGFFLSNHHIFRLDTESTMRGTLALAFGELLHKIWQGEPYSSVSAGILKDRVSKFAPQFTGYRQHDSQEFLRFLLDGLHEDLKASDNEEMHQFMQLRLDHDQVASKYKGSSAAMETYCQENLSCVVAAFGGQMVSQIECKTCGHQSCCYDPFLDISLPIPSTCQSKEGDTEVHNSRCHLLDCFKLFTEKEILEGENMYSCPNCNTRSPATKQLKFVSLPPVLVLHIKRFSYTDVSREKLVTALEFPQTGLDLSAFAVETECGEMKRPAVYDLKSVALHVGGMAGGHYHAFCLNRFGMFSFSSHAFRSVMLHPADSWKLLPRTALLFLLLLFVSLCVLNIILSENNCWYDFNDSRVSKAPIEQMARLASLLLRPHGFAGSFGALHLLLPTPRRPSSLVVSLVVNSDWARDLSTICG